MVSTHEHQKSLAAKNLRSHSVFLPVKLLALFLCTGLAAAVPDIEEARRQLGSQDTKVRESFTIKIWESGRETLPLLRELASDEDPEISNRAGYVLRRLRMGLTPRSPEELLTLAEAVDIAKPEKRRTVLNTLLEHPEGAPVGLVFLDNWASREPGNPERLSALAKMVTEALLEQRSYWKTFFTESLSPRCRGFLIAAISQQDLPMKGQMIEILGRKNTKEVYGHSLESTLELNQLAHRRLAGIAVAQGRLSLAAQILAEGFEVAEDPDLARNLAYLESVGQVDPLPHHGRWSDELNLFRARMKGDRAEVLRLARGLKKSPLLEYECNLLAGELSPPHSSKSNLLPGAPTLDPLHTFFGNPADNPDIEALASAVLIDWSTLAKTLAILGQPVEASETLLSNDQASSAVGLLLRTGHREKALKIANDILNGLDEKKQIRMRISLAKLHLENGDKDAAAKVFEPLIFQGIQRDDIRRAALATGLKILPREKILPLATNLLAERPYQRAGSIPVFLPYPGQVSVSWYEYFRKNDPLLPPSVLFKKVENFLNGDRSKAKELIAESVTTSAKSKLLPNDPLYQHALFLRLPEALSIVEKAAWYQLNTKDLLAIIRDDTWPLDTRKQALKTALQIDPTNISLAWFNLQLNGTGNLENLHLLTLGEAGSALKLGALTQKRETLARCIGVSNLKNHATFTVLSVLGKSYLDNNQPGEAVLLLQTALLGEIASGIQPSSSISKTLENLTLLYRAKLAQATDESEQAVWKDRLKRIGKAN